MTLLFPDDFPGQLVYKLDGEDYVERGGIWYKLRGWVPHGGRYADAVTEVALIDRLDSHAEPDHPGG